MVRMVKLVKNFLLKPHVHNVQIRYTSKVQTRFSPLPEYSGSRTQFRDAGRVTPLITPPWEADGAVERYSHTFK